MKGVEPKASVWSTLSDEEIVDRVRSGETGLFELLMRRYNQRVYRVSRAVLRDAAEAEELAQETWVRAYAHLDQFARRSLFSTWLTKIALHEARARARRRRRFESLESQAIALRRNPKVAVGNDPEQSASIRELQAALEKELDSLPLAYRTVFMLREVEGMSTAETAASLELTQAAVKVRLHRARARLRQGLLKRAGLPPTQMFLFLGDRCDRLVQAVCARIQRLTSSRAHRRSSERESATGTRRQLTSA